MSTNTRTPIRLLHLPQNRVIVCTTCQYCVLPRALDRHLKCIHHLPAIIRKRHLDDIRRLVGLADTNSQVVYPKAGADAIRELPVLNGYSCSAEGCRYLCVTAKRMQAHWRTRHSGHIRVREVQGYRCQRAQLQTFFRGNSLRYFVVSGTSLDSSSSPEIPPDGIEPSSLPPLGSVPYNNSNETAIEWLLLKKYMDCSQSGLLPCKATVQDTWRAQMMQVGTDADYLRYAILSLTANHVAFEHPDMRHLYGSEANRYRLLAIRSLPSQVTRIDSETFFPVFNFSRLMTLCCLASLQWAKMVGEYEFSTSRSMLPEWFQVQLQGRVLVWGQRGGGRIAEAMHGPPQRLFRANLMPEEDMYLNPFDEILEALSTSLRSLPDGDVDEVVFEALHVLRRVWAIPHRDNVNSFRDVALMWAVRVSSQYLDLVEAQDPAALVVFAHYCVLFSFSEPEYWYMRGHAETMLFRIVQRLDWQWQDWIAWPTAMIFGEGVAGSSIA